MATWRRCGRKWWLGTYRSLQPKYGPGPGTALHLGTLVHDALAAYYDPELKTNPVEFLDARLLKAIIEFPEQEEKFREETALARIMLSGYLEWLDTEGVDGDLIIEGTERMIEIKLVDAKDGWGQINILTKLDAPTFRERDGAKMALEHKTTGSLAQNLSDLKLNTQFLTEHLCRFLDAIDKGATSDEAYDQCHGILLNMLRKVKRTAKANPPFYGREDVPHNIHELRNHWKHVVAVARQIQTATARLDAGDDHHTVVPPNPTHDCSWDCPFNKICVMFDDGSDAEGALEAMYEEGDPLERYADVSAL